MSDAARLFDAGYTLHVFERDYWFQNGQQRTLVGKSLDEAVKLATEQVFKEGKPCISRQSET